MDQMKILRMLGIIFVTATVIDFSVQALEQKEILNAAGLSTGTTAEETDETSVTETDDGSWIDDGEWEEFEVTEGEVAPPGEEWIEVSEEESMYEPETTEMGSETTASAISMAPTPTTSMNSTESMAPASMGSAETADSAENSIDTSDVASMADDEWEVIEVEEGATAPTDEEWADIPESEMDEYETIEEAPEESEAA